LIINQSFTVLENISI